MTSVDHSNRLPANAISVSSTSAQVHYVDWGAIFAGAAVAAAIMTLLTTFGAAIGLSAVSPYSGAGMSSGALGIAAGLWVIWVTASSFLAGGYLTGRMRRRIQDSSEHESDVRDGVHGLIVWAIGSLLIAYIATASVAGLAKAVAGTAAAGAAAMTSGAAQGAAGVFDTSGIGARLWRTSLADKSAPDSVRQDGARVLAASAASGSISDEDKTYLTAAISAHTGLTQQDAAKRVEDTMSQINAGVQKARQAADTARRAGVLAAFLTAAALVLSAAAAWWAATMGGKHRDEGVDLSHFTAWR